METPNNNIQTGRRKFRLYEHPWWSLLVMDVTYVVTNILAGTVIFGVMGLSGYMQSRASIEIQALYGVILSIGVVPTTLMILWTRFFTSK